MPTRALFNKHRLRCTEQRLALYETLRECRSHPTADELYHMARDRVERLSRATVYNTLEALCQAGLAQKLPMSDGCCRYDADMREHLHVRFRDTCELMDVPEPLGRQLLESLPRELLGRIESSLGIRIDGVNLQLLAQKDCLP